MNLLWMLTNTGSQNNTTTNTNNGGGDLSGAEGVKDSLSTVFYENVWPWVQTVLWILVAVLAVVFIVKAVTTALAVMKAADEPQVRQEKLSSFKFLAIGLGVAIVVISLATVIVDLVLKNANAGDISTSFLLK